MKLFAGMYSPNKGCAKEDLIKSYHEYAQTIGNDRGQRIKTYELFNSEAARINFALDKPN